jgi:DNA-binding transcriptional LysR family regulator
MPNLHHLRYFYVFVEEGSVMRAAKRLSITQPALSNQLKQLEHQVGKKLFTREKGKIQFTKTGQLVYQHARQIFAVSESLRLALQAPEVKALHSVRIGICDQIDHLFALEIVKRLGECQKLGFHHHFTLSSLPVSVLEQKLSDGELELGLSNQPGSSSARIRNLREVTMPVNMVVSVEQMKRKFGENYGDLEGKDFVREWFKRGGELIKPEINTSLRRETDAFLAQHAFSAPIALEVNHVAMLVLAAAIGIGAAFVPISFLIDQSEKVVVCGPKAGFWQDHAWLLAPRWKSDHGQENLDAAIHDLMSA